MKTHVIPLRQRVKARVKKITPVRAVVFLIFIAYAIMLLVPYLFAFYVSLKTRLEYNSTLILAPPQSFNLQNYIDAWTALASEESGTSVPVMLLNSIWYAGGTAFFSVLFSSMGAYVVAKYNFRGRGFVYAFAIVTMMVPVMGSLPSQLRYVRAIGSLNSPLYAITMCQLLGTIFIVMHSAFKSISWEYAEAAFIDGAGPFSVFFRIMLPQASSVLVAMFLTNFIWLWADSETPMIFFDDLPPVALGLYQYKQIVDSNDPYASVPTFYAGLIMCMIPSLVLFSVFQKTLMDIQMGGGLKG